MRIAIVGMVLALAGCSDDPISHAQACHAEALKGDLGDRETKFVLACMGAKGYDYEFSCHERAEALFPEKVKDWCFEKRGSLNQWWREVRQ